jgi:hypothetical protein
MSLIPPHSEAHAKSDLGIADNAFADLRAGFSFYLRTPDGTRIGAKVLPKALPTVGALGRGAAGPVFLHVGTTFVEPTVAGYEPTEGATTDPYPAVPSACASANVLVRVRAVASAIVVTFMRCPSYR